MIFRVRCLTIAVAAAICLALSSCAGLRAPELSSGSVREDLSAVILVDPEADSAIKAAAAFFAEEVRERTGGAVKLLVEESQAAAGEFLNACQNGWENGSAAFIFAEGSSAGDICGCLGFFSEPFLYRDYEHFTMTINSALVFGELREAAPGALPLACFYTGSGFILSRLRIDEPTNFEGMVISDEDGLRYEDVPTVMMTDNDTARSRLYKALGGNPSVVPDAGRRVQAFDGEAAVVAEFSFAEAGRLLAGNISGEPVYLTRSYHNIEPLWLMGAEDFFSYLSAAEEAVVREAVASLFDNIDGAYLRAEDAAERELLSRCAEEAWDFTRSRRVIREFADSAATRTDREHRLLEYIYSLI